MLARFLLAVLLVTSAVAAVVDPWVMGGANTVDPFVPHGATTTTTVPSLPTCGGLGGCDTGCGGGFCFARIPSADFLCVDPPSCTPDTCAGDGDCAGGKYCVDASAFSIPSACCGPCNPGGTTTTTAASTTTTTTLYAPCNVVAYCDHPSPGCGGNCTSDEDCAVCGDGSVCRHSCLRPICVENSTIGCTAGHPSKFVCGGGASNAGDPCTFVGSDECPGGVCSMWVDTAGPLGYQTQCNAATGGTVSDCDGDMACDCTTSTTVTTTTTTTETTLP